jgi:hypothetical protein
MKNVLNDIWIARISMYVYRFPLSHPQLLSARMLSAIKDVWL